MTRPGSAYEHGRAYAQANEFCLCGNCLRLQFGYFSIRTRAFQRGFYRSIADTGIDAIYRVSTCPCGSKQLNNLET